ncbi:ABC-type multidrug transport system permease subunit [Halorubrum alkaliphilum]|uniref:ABC-type multidrug transport system permease subunit n=1 Tax=Halorubrum alkaliphilum TaxID=261290 RepID=A0A8T4GFC8_9EURY|nr:hypothetical protein [Halorubrum alkaliphilum]MBP1923208.1 ABC-type multidrug transport system permease subunit [Halorubrum alkaliphilum]
MEFNLPLAAGLVVLLIALGTGGLVGGGMMALETTLMMVVPSMIAFAAVVFFIGMKHGEFRASGA